MKICIGVFLLLLSVPFLLGSCGKIKTEELKLNASGDVITGYIAYDSSLQAKRPGIVVVPEYWGQKEYARGRARLLAELGYTALVIDIFDDGSQSQSGEKADAFASSIVANMDRARARFLAALHILKNHPTVDSSRIGALGYCYGGGVVLNMARLGTDLRTSVVFHGNLKSSEKTKRGAVKGTVLIYNAAADTFAPREDVLALTKEMTDANTNMIIVEFQGLHAFTNAGADKHAKERHIPTGYSKEADEQSWNEMGRYLKKHL